MDTLTQLRRFTTDDAHALLPQWQATMRAETKGPGTIGTYTYGLRTYLTWCRRHDAPPLARTMMTTWMSDMLAAGTAPGSARIRQLGVRRFVAWLIATGHAPVDPFAGVKGPKQTQKLVKPLTDDEQLALIATCTTPTHHANEPLHHRRDEAIIRLMFETAIRIGETIALRVDDLDAFELSADPIGAHPDVTMPTTAIPRSARRQPTHLSWRTLAPYGLWVRTAALHCAR